VWFNLSVHALSFRFYVCFFIITSLLHRLMRLMPIFGLPSGVAYRLKVAMNIIHLLGLMHGGLYFGIGTKGTEEPQRLNTTLPDVPSPILGNGTDTDDVEYIHRSEESCASNSISDASAKSKTVERSRSCAQ
jgi:hypothetical protein